MKDYVQEGLVMRISPKGICEEIEKVLTDTTLSEEDREDLKKQLKKAKSLSSLFKF